MKVLLGNNVIDNCAAVLIVNGAEVFRLRERAGDERLVCDFDVRDRTGRRLVKVAKNNVVFAAKGYGVKNLARESFVVDPDGKVIVRVEEVALDTVKITGDFWVGSYHVVITDQSLILGGLTLSDCTFSHSGAAISLEPGDMSIGQA